MATVQAEKVIGNAYTLGPEGRQFATPVVLTITLPAEFDGIDVSLMPYTIANMTATGWVEIPTTMNEATRQLTAALDHFSTYAAIPRALEPPVTQPDFTLNSAGGC